jgi:hypothetical protein
MVRAEDSTIFGTLSEAKSSQCRVCGKNLNFKDVKDKENSGSLGEAKHCGTIYNISASGTYMIGAMRDPKFVERERKLIENQDKANKLRRQGKGDEAAKLEEQNQKEAAQLGEDEETDEPKTSVNPRAESSREEEKRGTRR